ncbi:MAG: HAD hydrolase family protein, partial [Myxococcota bacterium]|nr:HAD hydrolase family protein [Myxococcota bacterium]
MRALSPRPLAELRDVPTLRGILCDIDDTLTWEGRLVPTALLALQRAQQAGLRVVPITGRPAGWVDHIARMWPVDGVVGENGGLWYWMDGTRLRRSFLQDAATRKSNRARLDTAAATILEEVPGT